LVQLRQVGVDRLSTAKMTNIAASGIVGAEVMRMAHHAVPFMAVANMATVCFPTVKVMGCTQMVAERFNRTD